MDLSWFRVDPGSSLDARPQQLSPLKFFNASMTSVAQHLFLWSLLQRGYALLQKLNLAFCLGVKVRHGNLAAFKASVFCPSFSQNAFRTQLAGDLPRRSPLRRLFLKKHYRVPIYARLPEDQGIPALSGAGLP
jgi:hypothetical protein